MSGRSNLIEQREERMQEKRRSMAQGDKVGKSPSQTRATITSGDGGGVVGGAMGQLKEEEEHKEQTVEGREHMQPPAIIVAS